MRGAPVGNDGGVSAERVVGDQACEGGYGWSSAALRPPRPVLVEVPLTAPKASLVVRAARITAGSVVTAFGIILLALPGPGLVMMAAGLSILSIDVPSAQRLLQQVRDRLPQDVDGGTPIWLLATMGAGLALSVGISVTFMLV